MTFWRHNVKPNTPRDFSYTPYLWRLQNWLTCTNVISQSELLECFCHVICDTTVYKRRLALSISCRLRFRQRNTFRMKLLLCGVKKYDDVYEDVLDAVKQFDTRIVIEIWSKNVLKSSSTRSGRVDKISGNVYMWSRHRLKRQHVLLFSEYC